MTSCPDKMQALSLGSCKDFYLYSSQVHTPATTGTLAAAGMSGTAGAPETLEIPHCKKRVKIK